MNVATVDTAAVKTVEDIRTAVEAAPANHVKVGVCDVDGILRGKYMARDKFLSSLDGGFGFCDVVLGWDSNDQLYDNAKMTGWHTGYGDAPVRILPETMRSLPSEPGVMFFMGEFTGEMEPICPRGVLRRVLERGEALGFRAKAACEFEFLVVEETARTLSEKRFSGLTPHGAGNFGYSVIRNSVNTSFYQGLLDFFDAFGVPIEGLHEETGPGALEAAIRVDEAMEAGTRGVLFKTFAKVVAQRMDLFASFMAKWNSDMPGQGGHVHVSLQDREGRGVFRDESCSEGLSRTMRHFIGGLQRLSPEITALSAPTVNSYKRLVPGYWAPTAATWGVDNRTVAIRAITGSDKSQRVEYRIPGADTNPYLVLAAALGAGFWGIENEVEPSGAMTGNAYTQACEDRFQLPRTLGEASVALENSAAAREIFGDAFVDHFAASRMWEEREARRQVTDWEMARYFEII
ncbi:glutamine synthetase family protein [Roseibium sp.]|uniref:glutamine synthetase family protein n=1 Tax=Roseibium sp. TaxID=1936156 RepID=UPI003D116BDE